MRFKIHDWGFEQIEVALLTARRGNARQPVTLRVHPVRHAELRAQAKESGAIRYEPEGEFKELTVRDLGGVMIREDESCSTEEFFIESR